MARRLPTIKQSSRILIICEGNEEYEYLSRLKVCKVWSHDFSIDLKNAESIDNIVSLYEYHYQSGNYKLVVVCCDTEKAPYVQFMSLIKKIDDVHGKNSSTHIVFFTNPCTMQVILSHFAAVSLKSNLKTANSKLIKKLTGVENYRATKKQLVSIMKQIDSSNYQTMKNNISGLSTSMTTVPSSNMLNLFNSLEIGKKKWIVDINKKLI